MVEEIAEDVPGDTTGGVEHCVCGLVILRFFTVASGTTRISPLDRVVGMLEV